MLGLLTYLPTTAYFPQFMFLLAFLFVLVRDRRSLMDAVSKFQSESNHPVNWNFLIICIIIFFSFLNRLIHWKSVNDISEIFPYFILLIPTYVIAVCLKKEDVKWLVGLISMEAVIVISQWTLGVSTFDSSLEGFATFENDSLAYFQRPFGFSAGSSIMATKMFLAFFLIDFFQLKGKWNYPLKMLLILGISFTFNRTVILSLGVYLMLSSVVSFLSLKYMVEKAWVGFLVFILGGIGFLSIVALKSREIIAQFTRNTGSVELTGREYIWQDFLDFIFSHLTFGNYSIKLWLDGYHAHNSYLELIATNGVFISILYFILIYRNVSKSNWVYIFPILIFGITQYAFFWGVSLFDIVFFAILVQNRGNNKSINLEPNSLTPKERLEGVRQ